MVRLIISIVLTLAGNALGLLIAAWILNDMTLEASGFIIAVLIFTGVEILAQPLLAKMARKNLEALLGSVALITTFVGLLVTELISNGLDISGAWTWVLATIIVWLATLIAQILLPAIFLKETVERARD